MKIGFFDSGLGGLFILSKTVKVLPQYDYLFLADLKRSPYGDRSVGEVYDLTRQAVDYLFARDCQIIIVACNTASALALRKLQQEYLSLNWPGRRLLGMITPTIEKSVSLKIKKLGILATSATVRSKFYLQEFNKAAPGLKIFQQAAPRLVPLIEKDELAFIEPVLEKYLKPLLKKRPEAIILACTHYAILKKLVKKIAGLKIKVISQDEIIPQKIAAYLKKHPEIAAKISRRGRIDFEATKPDQNFSRTAKKWFGNKVKLKLAKY